MDPIISPALSQIASNSLLGAICVVLLVAYYKKDKQLQEQSERNLNLILTIQEKVITAVTKLADLMDYFEKRERGRDSRDKHHGGGPS